MNMFAKTAVAAAIPLAIAPTIGPVSAASMPAPASASASPSAIAKLWAKREKLVLEYRAAHKKLKKLEREALLRAGNPDPAILYSKANAALGLAFPGRKARNPNSRFGAYVWPGEIQREIGKLDPTLAQMSALAGRPYKITKKQNAKREKLKAILEIARRYDTKVRSIEDELGCEEINENLEATVAAQGDIEIRILKTKSTSHSDLKCKFTICQDCTQWTKYIAQELRPFAMTGDKATLAFAA